MSKFLSQKKKLLEDVFEKASNETTEKSPSGILKSLERSLLDDFKVNLSYKTFETYYKTIVESEKDYNIKPVILDDLSNYLGYDNFKNYCLDWKTIEYTINQTVSRIVINIINKPILAMPDFIKKNGLGLVEMAFVIFLVTGGVIFSNNKKYDDGMRHSLGIMSGGKLDVEKNYMYWDGDRYIATDSSDLGPQLKVVAMNPHDFRYFKRINRPDTLNVDNSLGKVWYDKSKNHVEFFTSYGKHPKNEKALKDVSEGILENYAGQNAKLEE
ncbi:hypothetical protein ACNFU2_13500 [Chryseobacterium sp. PTM-20240506]|uniref:hypothetical protein n=1 Tax=unclassified Chryseobacterium TaxID=2593645 RepID=UPI002358B130|nr:hypothetical protein [Chryseobacterium sp. B21-037]MDC8105907.1 hypothetical protein [Chryseobacterium sp. B21-037]